MTQYADSPDTFFEKSSFVWAPDPASRRNQFVSFEQQIPATYNKPVRLHLFADSRYRLFVNDRFIAYGPSRFVTAFPRYDSHDLTCLLTQPVNLIRVEVNFFGSSSFQTMPDGQPGFIAAGGDGETLNFATPGQWRVRTHRAWRADAPAFSFAQNPAEILDTRLLDSERSTQELPPPAPCPESASPWGSLQPRNSPTPPYHALSPQRLQVTAEITTPFVRAGWLAHAPDLAQSSGSKQGTSTQRFVTWLHTENAQTVELESYWCELWLNGTSVERDGGNSPHNTHGLSVLPLRCGWNLLSGTFGVLRNYWSFLCGLPREGGVSWHARPDLDETAIFALGPIENDTPLPLEADAECFTLPEGWHLDSGDASRVAPGQRVSWDELDESTAVRNLPLKDLSAHNQYPTAATATWVFDFNDQYHGHPCLEVEGPAGTILDVAYDDWKAPDGQVAIYKSNPMTDATDRFVLRGGRQRIEVTNPRGGIYMQVTLRRPDRGEGPLALHDVQIRSRRTLDRSRASFSSGHDIFDWAWDRAVHTLIAATDESYTDCPWRERGAYVGDCLVSMHLNRLIATDLPVARRALEIFGEAQREDGLISGVAPSWLTRSLCDYALLWVVALKDYWDLTGDGSLLEWAWPRIKTLLASPMWEIGEYGLWNLDERHTQFLDWGTPKGEDTGPANTTINLLRVAALDAASGIASVLERETEERQLTSEARKVRKAIETHLWLPEEQRFAARGDTPGTALHANILALRYQVGDTRAVLNYLRPLLENNLQRGLQEGREGDIAELYFFHFLLPALAQQGEHALIEQVITHHYGYLKDFASPTLPECFTHASLQKGSRCHMWSGSPALYLTHQALGLRQETPGDPHSWVLDPAPGSLQQAEGTFPAGDGWMTVSWKRENGRLYATATLPAGARLTTVRSDIHLVAH